MESKCFFFSGVMNLKNQSYITMASEMKGEIGYITSSNLQPKPQKVKAAIANIPVGTESLQKFNTLPGKFFICQDGIFLLLVFHVTRLVQALNTLLLICALITLNLLNFLNGLARLSFLEVSIIIIGDV